MELVLSPGGGGGDAGSPFRNEDVREWSRVDRITGMLERARVETDRWQADTQDAKQSYGKVTDSRQRNSADGSLVQKARRQVEIFQSQGNAGRNLQVVRASQWSSSRATDRALDAKPSNARCINATMNGEAFNSRLSLWRPSLADTASDLDRLSYLCRKLHDEAMSNASFWPLGAPLASLPLDSSRFEEMERGIELADERLSPSDRLSNSSEDLPSLQLSNGDESFARDCKTRRSLQITNNLDGGDDRSDAKARTSRADLIAERAKRFEHPPTAATITDNGEKKSFISTKTFMPIANNDFVKNDPMHPSKFNQTAKISIQDNALHNGHRTMHVSSPTTRKANNKTVVHLRNAASPDAQLPAPRCINVTAIKLEKDAEENGAYDRSTESSAKDDTTPTTPTTPTTTTTMVNASKPVKKVEFCKTEIHFAADSGKVNIVETDGKPPPTNKFRRRRRNHSLNSAIGTNPQKSNLPVVHFGDTSYEKYIFGGGKVPPPPPPPPAAAAAAAAAQSSQDEHKTDDSAIAATTDESNSKNFEANRWDVTNGKEIATRDSFTDTSLDKVMEHVGKFKGAHTTTVNFLSDERKALATLGEDKPSSSFGLGKGQLRSEDSEQVQMKVVTTHKPIVARVDEHPAAKACRPKNQTDEEKVKSHRSEDVGQSAKEHCDKASDADEPPVYENIFEAVSDGAPLYENVHRFAKAIPAASDIADEKTRVPKKPSTGPPHRKAAAKASSEPINKPVRSASSVTPKSEKESSNSRSRDSSMKRRKEASSPTKKSGSSVQQRKGTPTNLLTDKNALKAKKPVEVVYKTAVYNMKNEKLSKPSKSKEVKGPRLINELICGTKLKKPTDAKKIIKTAVVSQNNTRKKETPTAIMNR